MRADIVVLDETHPALIGRSRRRPPGLVDILRRQSLRETVFVAGEQLVKDRRHRNEAAIARRFEKAMMRLMN